MIEIVSSRIEATPNANEKPACIPELMAFLIEVPHEVIAPGANLFDAIWYPPESC